MQKEDEGTQASPLQVAAAMGDFDLAKNLLDAGLPYEPSAEGDSPLSIAAQEPCYYRLVTLLCLHGADPLVELPPNTLDDLSLLVATKLNSVGDSEEDYERRFLLTLVYTKCLHIIGCVAAGALEPGLGASLLRGAREESAEVLARYDVPEEQLSEEVRGYVRE